MIRHLLLVAVGLGAVTACVVGDRDWGLTNRPGVDLVAELSGKADEAKLNHFLTDGVVIVPAPGDPREGPNSPPMLGYSYREVALIGLPFLAYPDMGFVLFDETPTGLRAYPIDAAYLRLLESEAGVPLARDYGFPYYRFLWGWLFIAAIAAWVFLQRRAKARGRVVLATA